ncbi:MAG: cyclic pyranopterin monophosphate synthase MoaC [Pseudobacteriovorax sp.]|nr:cyclic pyranopterin monophosphate synthase MoaC [Pseudobacteriovorax sp.]
MGLTHIDQKNQPTMVDVSDKSLTKRSATAECFVELGGDIMKHLSDGDLLSKKGPVFATAIIAGTQGVKRCADLIPFCHVIPIESCRITIDPVSADTVRVLCEVQTTYKTGVEMEALTGASVAGLTIIDMCKAMSQTITLTQTKLIEKTGGKRDFKASSSLSSH